MSQVGALNFNGGGGVIVTIDGDVGSVTGATIAFLATPNGGSSMQFNGAATTMDLNVTDVLSNTLIGKSAGNGTLTGNNNTSVGKTSLNALTSGSMNVGLGSATLVNANSGSFNTAIGQNSTFSLTTGIHNTSLGYLSLQNLTTGDNNIVIGDSAATNYTSTESSNIIIGNTGTLGESNVIHIGTQGSGVGEQNKAFMAGIVGVTTSNTNFVTIDTTTGQLGAAPPSLETWTDTSGAFIAVVDNGYFLTAASTPLLPPAPAQGDRVDFVCDTGALVTVTANAGQSIRIGSALSAVAGTAASNTIGNSIELVFRAATNTWFSIGAPEGTWTVT